MNVQPDRNYAIHRRILVVMVIVYLCFVALTAIQALSVAGLPVIGLDGELNKPSYVDPQFYMLAALLLVLYVGAPVAMAFYARWIQRGTKPKQITILPASNWPPPTVH